MKKKIFWWSLAILWGYTLVVYAQQGKMDSLLSALQTAKEDSNKVQILCTLSDLLIQSGDYAKSLQNAEKALTLAEKLKNKKGIAEAYDIFGNIYTYQGKYPNALDFFLRELEILEDIDDKQGMIDSYFSIGNIYENLDNSANALIYYIKAMKIVENSPDKYDSSGGYHNIMGIVYREQGNYPEAMVNLFKGLKIAEDHNNLYYIAVICSNIGTTYLHQGNYQEALRYHLRALKVKEEIGDKSYLLLIFNLIGRDYELQGNYEEALKYYLQSLENCEGARNKYGTARSFIIIGKFYSNQNKFSSAVDSLKMGVALAKEIGSKELIKDGYDILSTTYYRLKNLDSTYHYFNLFSEMKDSMLNEENSKQLNEMEVKYETEKKDKEITKLHFDNEKKQSQLALLSKQELIARLNLKTELQQKELVTSENKRNKQSLLLADNLRKQQQDSIRNLSLQKTLMAQLASNERNKRNWTTAGGIGLAALLSLMFYQLYYRRQTKYNLQINHLNNKVLRTQLNPHFIFNALNSIKSFIDEHPETASRYLTKFSTLMRQVLENSEEEKITLEEEIAMLKNYMQLESLRVNEGFEYEIIMDEKIDDSNTMLPPLILQPMVENAIWHGLKPLNRKGKITLRFKESNGLLEATIEDDGIGIGSTTVSTSTTEKKRSMGIQITRERIELLNRKAKAKGWLRQNLFEQGSQVEIAIPV